MEDFLAISIVGVALSFLIESIKGFFGEGSFKAKLLTIVLSIIVGGGYALLKSTVWWATILTVLTSASAVYALVLKR